MVLMYSIIRNQGRLPNITYSKNISKSSPLGSIPIKNKHTCKLVYSSLADKLMTFGPLEERNKPEYSLLFIRDISNQSPLKNQTFCFIWVKVGSHLNYPWENYFYITWQLCLVERLIYSMTLLIAALNLIIKTGHRIKTKLQNWKFLF